MPQNSPRLRDKPFTVFVWTLCIAFVVVGLIHAVLIAFAPAIYISEAVVAFSVDSTNSLAHSASSPHQVLGEFRTLNSPELGMRVVKELQLDEVWGKRYNQGVALSLHDTLMMLIGRMDVRCPQNAHKITIRIYGEDPVETVKIANSLAWNYCNGFTKSRGISARILQYAELPAEVVHATLIIDIPKAVLRSAVIALLAAGVAWGIAKALVHMSPPGPYEKRAPQRFQKY